MLVVQRSPATKSFASCVVGSLVLQLRLRCRLEVPVGERPAEVLFVVGGDYCEVASLDLVAVKNLPSQ
jgi:hypothetical protein